MNFIKSVLSLALFIGSVAYANDVTVTEHTAWARATPPGAKTTAIYLSLMNHTDAAIELTGAKSNISDRLELHTHLNEDGMMKMRQVDAITADANSTIELKPHGLHIMVFDLSRALQEGETIELKLHFNGQIPIELNVPVLKEGPSASRHGEEHGKKHEKKKHKHNN